MSRYLPQIVLPFTDIGQPWGIAVDAAGAVVISEFERNPQAPPGIGATLWARVSRLEVGAGGSAVLPIAGLASPRGVAVDAAGAVYVADGNIATPIRLAAGSADPEVLAPVGKEATVVDVALDADGGLYACFAPGLSSGLNRGGVVKDAGRAKRRLFGGKPDILPFEVRFPSGVAVDGRGAVYVVDLGGVFVLAPGASTPEKLPLVGLEKPAAVAVDARGDVYVTDEAGGGRVVVLAAGTSEQSVLPFEGLQYPRGVAVDAGGSVYVADYGNRRVVKLGVNDTSLNW